MAASVKIEFDDGSRVISQTLEDAAGVTDARGGGSALSGDKRPASCSIDDFYEIPKTTAFIADGKFRRVALQFPDALLREAPEVLWTLQARLRKLAAGSGRSQEKKNRQDISGGEGSAGAAAATATAAAAQPPQTPPLIFVTGDTSYGSCCVDEVSAQHLKADAIVHYGRACLSPTNSSVPVLYVFGRGQLDVSDLASSLLSGPLSSQGGTSSSSAAAEAGEGGNTGGSSGGGGGGSSSSTPPVLLLYDVTYAYAIPALLEALAAGDGPAAMEGRLAVGFPTPEAYSPLGASGMSAAAGPGGAAGCGCVAASPPPRQQQQQPPPGGPSVEAGTGGGSRSGAVGEGRPAGGCCRPDGGEPCCGGAAPAEPARPLSSEEENTGGRESEALAPCATAAGCGGGGGSGVPVGASAVEREESPPCCSPEATSEGLPGGSPNAEVGCAAAAAAAAAPTATATGTLPTAASGVPQQQQQQQRQSEKERRRVRIGGLGVELESEEDLKRHALVFVGAEGRQLSNVLMRCAGCVDRVRYDPALPAGRRVVGDTRKGNKDLMRRYYLVQRAREAGVIGIVVGTLGVRRYGSVVRSIRKMVEDAGRKAYTLAVGKVNVAKLANFAEVDVFCLVACAENSLLDSREFHAPVVTPLELEVALGKREWDGFYSTDFEDLLGSGPQIAPSPRPPPPPSGIDDEMGSLALVDPPPATGGARKAAGGDGDGGTVSEADNGGGGDDDDEPFFSLVTGTYQNKPGVSRRPPGEATGGGSGVEAAGGGGALVGVGDRSLVEWTSPAADFLGKREFKGLEALVGQTEAKAATEGQSGIASDYGGV